MNLDNRRKPTNKKKIFDFANISQKLKGSAGGTIRMRNTAKSKANFSDVKKSNSKFGKGSKFRRILRKTAIGFSLFILFSILFGVIFAIALVSSYSKDLPDMEKYFAELDKDSKDTIITDRNGVELYRLQGDIVRERVKLSEIPDRLEWAFLAAEDADYWNHKGLNVTGLGRAVVCAAQNKGKAVCGGGSSITQQLIKNTTSMNQNSLERKIKEAVLAMQIEKKNYPGYSSAKEYILEFYLNIVPEGGVAQGVKSGSIFLFGKEDLNQLTLAEMAYLAAIPNEPTVFSPLGGKFYNKEKSVARATYVLDRMKHLDQKEKDKLSLTNEEIDKAITELANVEFKDRVVNKRAPHYVDYVINEVLDEIYKDEVNQETQVGSDYLRGKGAVVRTAVDIETQELLENTLKDRVDSEDYQTVVGAANAAGVIMDPRNGELLAIVGSKDYYAKAEDKYFSPKFNAATQAWRSMGSSVKPFTYMDGFINAGMHPGTILPNFRITYQGGYAPHNFGYTYENYGSLVSARTALAYSLNIPAVGTFEIAGGPESYADLYIKLHGNEDFREQVQGASATLGAANMRLIDQVHAYATLANNGLYNEKIAILDIKDSEGKTIYEPKREGKQVIEAKYAYLAHTMNENYYLLKNDDLIATIQQNMYFGGKTGTSDTESGDPADLAFVAYTPTFTMGMWSGNSCSPSECPLVNGTNPESEFLYRLVYKDFLSQYWSKIEPARYEVPSGVVRTNICPVTGRVWSEDCPAEAVGEWAADTGLPKKEDMIQKVWVVQCGDQLKLARQVDKDAKLAEERKFVVYKFDDPWIQSQVTAYQKGKNELPPTEECNIERNLKKPEVQVLLPSPNTEYEVGDVVQVKANIKSDIGIQRVDIYLDNILQKSLTSAPYETSFFLPNNIKTGKHKITVLAQDKRGDSKGQTSVDVEIFVLNDIIDGPTPTPTPTPIVTISPIITISPTTGGPGNGNGNGNN